MLDRDAIVAYRARARDLRASIDEAATRHDDGAAEIARRELAFLEDELRGAIGLGGRSRRAASEIERIRVNVTTRIRKAIDRLRQRAPGLAHHLSTTIKTGTTCTYRRPP
jgi:non-specific serine/threonine protein kinase